MSKLLTIQLTGINCQQQQDLVISGCIADESPLAGNAVEIKVAQPVSRELVVQALQAFTTGAQLRLTTTTDMAEPPVTKAETDTPRPETSEAAAPQKTERQMTTSASSSAADVKLQTITSAADFEPDQLGATTAARVETPPSEVSAVPAIEAAAESINYRQPGNFSATDFEPQPDDSEQPEKVYGSDGKQFSDDGGLPMG